MAARLHPRNIQLAVVGWIDERFGLSDSIDEALRQPVPNYANAFYYCFGGIVFILFGLQILTGILLAFYYSPSAQTFAGTTESGAYHSVQTIMNDVYLGWLIRGVHFWGANLMVVMVLLHGARVYFTGSYRKPRELNWVIGVLLALMTLGFALTGYLLPYDLKAFWATRVAGNIPLAQPGPGFGLADNLGGIIRLVLLGGSTIGQATLTRFYSLHVFVLPALTILLMFGHFKLIRKHGISEAL
ncbi:MAG: cytochrome b N-terminal domain-containing protein [Candidatus Dormibacteria bacterium]